MDREISALAVTRRVDEDALAKIFEQYAPDLYRYAFRLCGNAVISDRIVGNVFERYLQQISAGKTPGVNPRLYLYEIAYSILVRDFGHGGYFSGPERGMQGRCERWSSEKGADDQRLLVAIQRALIHDLTEDQRHVILLRFTLGFSLKETAAITGKKVNHVKVIQNRAIAALRRNIDFPASETHTITLFLRRLAQA